MSDGKNEKFGVSSEGIQEIFNSIHTALVNDASEKIKDTAAVKEALGAGWKGTDCEIFLANLETLGVKVTAKLEEYDQNIADEFYKIQDQWTSFQESNVKPT